MRTALQKNCGIEALERYLAFRRKARGEEFFMSIRSLLSLSQDEGLKMDAYWVSAEDLGVLKGAFILYAPDQKHFVALKAKNRLPWFSIPKRVVVITEINHPRFQKLTEKEKTELKGAKGETTIQAAQPAPQPSTADAIKAWVESMPQVYETQLKYAPQEAAMQVQLAQQYAQPYGEAMKAAQEALYPGTSAIQEKLAGQALQGMESAPPQWMRDQYLSDLRANLGQNVGSGIAADYTSRGLLSLNEEWRRYNQNLGLTVTGRQPLTQAATPQTSNYMQGFTPESVMGYKANTYGSYTGAQANMYGSALNYNAQMSGQRNAMWGTLAGAGMGMIGQSKYW